MAGSMNHVTTDSGRLIGEVDFPDMIENLGDAYEAIEEMWGIIAVLAGGDADAVERAKEDFERGVAGGLDRKLAW